MAEHPDSDTGLCQGAEDGSDALSHEEGAGRDLEVVTQFHVHSEVDALADDVGREGFEDDVCEGFALEEVAAEEFAEDGELVCIDVSDALDNAAGDHVDGWDDDGDDDAPDGEFGVVNFDDDDGDDGDYEDDDAVPPPGDFAVGAHEAAVDVEFAAALEGVPDFGSVPEVDVREDRGDGCEGEAVDEGEGGSEERRGVVPVRLDV